MKTESDISSLSQLLTKLTVETALGAEMEEHLGYGRHERSDIRIIAMVTPESF
ncbi:MAG: hypothetical protein Q9M14_07930 [Mariprofundaceae bacterium]|nr:hypothetical protein [Mariprofundaceae bacterium]